MSDRLAYSVTDIGLSQVAAKTGLSTRYWQKMALAGKLPGASYIVLGERRGAPLELQTGAP